MFVKKHVHQFLFHSFVIFLISLSIWILFYTWGLGESLSSSIYRAMAAFTCTSRPPISLRSETKIVSSPSASSLSSRRMFAVLPESSGLRIRLSLSPASLTSIHHHPRVSRLRRAIVCEAQETTTDSMFSHSSFSIFGY